MRKIRALFIIMTMMLTIGLPLFRAEVRAGFADISVSDDYIITWEPEEGATKYVLGLEDGYRASFSPESNLSWDFKQYAVRHCYRSGTYHVSISVEEDPVGFTNYATVEYISDLPEIGEIRDLRFENGYLMWDPVKSPEGVEAEYKLDVFSRQSNGNYINTDFELKESKIDACLFTEDGMQEVHVTLTASVPGYQMAIIDERLEYESDLPTIDNLRIEGPYVIFDEIPGANRYEIRYNSGTSAGSMRFKVQAVDGVAKFALTDYMSLIGSGDGKPLSITVRALKYIGNRNGFCSKESKPVIFNSAYETYPLTVRRTRITSLHDLNDILDDGGSVSYDPALNKLTFNGLVLDEYVSDTDDTAALFYSENDLTVDGNAEISFYGPVFRIAGDLTFEEGSNLEIRSQRYTAVNAKNITIRSRYLTAYCEKDFALFASSGNITIGPSCGRIDLSDDNRRIPYLCSKLVLDGSRILEPEGAVIRDNFIIYNKDGSSPTRVVFGTLKATPTPTPIPTSTPTPKPKPTSAPTSAIRPTVTVTSKPTSGVPSPTPVTGPTTSPKTTAKPSVKPAVTASVTSTPSEDPKSRISEFVKRIYTYVLNREPEKEGAEFWSDELWSFRRSGAEVGLQFIFSDEFKGRGLSDDDFVTVLYKTFFGRDPEEEGFKFWTSALKDGTLSREQVAYGFVYSQEWADTCAAYGIRSGGDIKPSIEIEPTDLTYAFVERMYTTAMDRASDNEGAGFWARELSNFRFTGEQVGLMFFLSDEMKGFGLSDEEYVTRLYRTFMDREPEEGGFNFWVGYLKDGNARDNAVLGFTRSEEFLSKCIEARILPF